MINKYRDLLTWFLLATLPLISACQTTQKPEVDPLEQSVEEAMATGNISVKVCSNLLSEFVEYPRGYSRLMTRLIISHMEVASKCYRQTLEPAERIAVLALIASSGEPSLPTVELVAAEIRSAAPLEVRASAIRALGALSGKYSARQRSGWSHDPAVLPILRSTTEFLWKRVLKLHDDADIAADALARPEFFDAHNELKQLVGVLSRTKNAHLRETILSIISGAIWDKTEMLDMLESPDPDLSLIALAHFQNFVYRYVMIPDWHYGSAGLFSFAQDPKKRDPPSLPAWLPPRMDTFVASLSRLSIGTNAKAAERAIDVLGSLGPMAHKSLPALHLRARMQDRIGYCAMLSILRIHPDLSITNQLVDALRRGLGLPMDIMIPVLSFQETRITALKALSMVNGLPADQAIRSLVALMLMSRTISDDPRFTQEVYQTAIRTAVSKETAHLAHEWLRSNHALSGYDLTVLVRENPSFAE